MNQFSAKRMVGIGIVSLATILWMIYLQVEKTPFGAPSAPTSSEWSQYWPHAIASVVLVVVVDAVVVALTLKRARRLEETGEAR